MMKSWLRRIAFLGVLTMAIPTSGTASLVLAQLDVPTVNTQTYISVDLETQTFAVGGATVGDGQDFVIYTSLLGVPSYILGWTGTDGIFCSNLASIGLLGAGVTVDAASATGYPGPNFQNYAYFTPPPAAGNYFLGFQTNANLDGDGGTTGTHYGFFEIEVGSLTVVGYGFESTPGVGAVTTAVPEPTAGVLALLALGGAVILRRRVTFRKTE